MFGKGIQGHVQRAYIGAKHHITRMYHEGHKFAQKLDAGYQIYKRLHGALAPAIKDVAPQVVQHSKKFQEGYERTKAHALSAHESVERVVHSVKKAVPELGL